MPATEQPLEWLNHDINNCLAGTLSDNFRAKAFDAINFQRVLAGLSPVTEHAMASSDAQEAALVFQRNGFVAHEWTDTPHCDSAAAKRGAEGNIYSGPDQTAATMAAGFVADPGEANTAVGHRRWMLRPAAGTMGIGASTNTGSIVTRVTTNTDPKKPLFTPWPNNGYAPAQLEPNGRWSLSSFSMMNEEVFANAKVQVWRADTGEELTVTQYPLQYGYAADTLVWEVPQAATLAAATIGTDNEAVFRVLVTGLNFQGWDHHEYTVKYFDGTRGVPTPVAPTVAKVDDATGEVGDVVNFTTSPTGTPAPTVQWQKSADGVTWTDIPGATNNLPFDHPGCRR